MPVVADSYQFSSQRPALDSEIRHFLQNRAIPPSELEARTQQYAADIVHGSMSVVQRALALRAVATRFEARELAGLDPISKRRWIALVQRHAEALHENAVLLDHQLAPIFYPGRAMQDDPRSLPATASEVAGARKKLFETWDECDHQLSAALSLSLKDQRIPVVDWARIRSSLSEISTASTGIQLVAERLTSNSTFK